MKALLPASPFAILPAIVASVLLAGCGTLKMSSGDNVKTYTRDITPVFSGLSGASMIVPLGDGGFVTYDLRTEDSNFTLVRLDDTLGLVWQTSMERPADLPEFVENEFIPEGSSYLMSDEPDPPHEAALLLKHWQRSVVTLGFYRDDNDSMALVGRVVDQNTGRVLKTTILQRVLIDDHFDDEVGGRFFAVESVDSTKIFAFRYVESEEASEAILEGVIFDPEFTTVVPRRVVFDRSETDEVLDNIALDYKGNIYATGRPENETFRLYRCADERASVIGEWTIPDSLDGDVVDDLLPVYDQAGVVTVFYRLRDGSDLIGIGKERFSIDSGTAGPGLYIPIEGDQLETYTGESDFDRMGGMTTFYRKQGHTISAIVVPQTTYTIYRRRRGLIITTYRSTTLGDFMVATFDTAGAMTGATRIERNFTMSGADSRVLPWSVEKLADGRIRIVYGDEEGLLLCDFNPANAALIRPAERLMNIENLVYAGASMKWLDEKTLVLLGVDTDTPRGLLLLIKLTGSISAAPR